MTTPDFHPTAGPFTVARLAEALGLEFDGDADHTLTHIAALDTARADSLSFLDNPRYQSQAAATAAGAVIIAPKHAHILPEGTTALLADQPYVAYARALQAFYPELTPELGVSPHAHVADTATIGEGVTIAPGAVIGAQVAIGAGTIVGANVVIGDKVIIGQNCRIDANVTITCAVIGDGVRIFPNVAIGQPGFGHAHTGSEIVRLPHIGCVRIGNDVEIGAGTTIDRGSLGETVIGDGTHIDNLVQIGHNVKLGRNCQIVAQVGIAGSTKLGDNVVAGGQSGFAGHLSIADDVKIAAKAGVTKSIDEKGQVMAGFPAVPIAQWRRMQATMARAAKTGHDKANQTDDDTQAEQSHG